MARRYRALRRSGSSANGGEGKKRLLAGGSKRNPASWRRGRRRPADEGLQQSDRPGLGGSAALRSAELQADSVARAALASRRAACKDGETLACCYLRRKAWPIVRGADARKQERRRVAGSLG